MNSNERVSAFSLCGVSFHERVITQYGEGIVQGILKEDDGSLKVIVSHDPRNIPPELLPSYNVKWKLMYYKPEQIKKETNGHKRKTR